MIPVDLVRIIIRDGVKPEQLVFLREREGQREFAIVIGRFEADAIRRRVHETPMARPMTHDLLHSVIGDLGARVERVVVSRLEGGTFFAELHLCSESAETRVVDCRPSDAIALAVRTETPLFVSEEVFRQVCPEGAFLDLDP